MRRGRRRGTQREESRKDGLDVGVEVEQTFRHVVAFYRIRDRLIR